MNQIRAIQALNKKEIENGISPDASWHVDYRDTAYVYFGGLPYELSEGDIITIFSQFGEPTFLKLSRDKETGKSKGFGWLKYEDQRSTDLAVDNLGGAEISGRLVRVDHARYKSRDDEDPEEFKVGWEDVMKKQDQNLDEESNEEEEVQRPALPEEKELALLMKDHDDDDPMKGFLIEEKKKEVEEARLKADKTQKRHRHRHRHSRRSRRDSSEEGYPKRGKLDETPVDDDYRRKDRDSRRHRDRDDSRDRERRRRRHVGEERGRREDLDRDGRHRRREPSDSSRTRSHRHHRDDDRLSRRTRRRSRSRSPRQHGE